LKDKYDHRKSLLRISANKEKELEPEATVKKKLLSAWNNVKYGKKAWSAGDMLQQAKFSTNSPVWLLGQAYHRKLSQGADSHPEGSSVNTFSDSDSGIEAFQQDYQSRLWFTYRQGFECLPSSNLTSDCGWGCMIRSGQMMLSQGLILHKLGRHWRAHRSNQRQEEIHKKIVDLFVDSPEKPLSIHSLLSFSKEFGHVAGSWLGPSTVAYLMSKAANNKESILKDIAVYVAQDCTVYKKDVEMLCNIQQDIEHNMSASSISIEDSNFSILDIPLENGSEDYSLSEDVVIDGSVWCMEKESGNTKHTLEALWKSLIILIPVRLGSDELNPIYNSCFKNILSLDTCIGIIGGKPKHSLYFVGFQDDQLIHLDPHRLQDAVDTSVPNYSINSFHCSVARKLPIKKMDPCCCVGFYLHTKEDYETWCETIEFLVTPPQIAGLRRDYPMFVINPNNAPTFDCQAGREDWVSINSNKSELGQEGEEFIFL